MRVMNKVDLEVGNSDIPISIFSAIEKDTSFKQFSKCCKESVRYNKVCSECGRDCSIESDNVFKGLLVGDEIKPIDTDEIKADNGNLNILGKVEVDLEENVFFNGNVWFLGYQKDSKNKRKTEKNLMKFSYFREALKESNSVFLGVISIRGKEQIILVKPYFNCLVGLGVYHFENIRDFKELALESFETDKSVVKEMSKKIQEQKNILFKEIENKREIAIRNSFERKTGTDMKTTEEKQLENPLELVSF